MGKKTRHVSAGFKHYPLPEFIEQDVDGERRFYNVVSELDGQSRTFGTIEYIQELGRYAFYPSESLVSFGSGCLHKIADFVDAINKVVDK